MPLFKVVLQTTFDVYVAALDEAAAEVLAMDVHVVDAMGGKDLEWTVEATTEITNPDDIQDARDYTYIYNETALDEEEANE